MTKKVEARNAENIRQGSPGGTGTYAETIPRWLADSNIAIAATGVVLSTGIPLQNGDTVTNITFETATTAAGTPTAGFAALYSPAGVLLAQTADFGSTARAANTQYTVALATPQTISAAGLYYVAISFTAGTVPTLVGHAVFNALQAGAGSITTPSTRKVLAQTHGSAVGATAPATITSATAVTTIPYLVCT